MELNPELNNVTPMRDTAVKPDDTSRQLNKLRVKILFEQSIPTQFGSLVIAVIYVFLVRHKATPLFLSLWTGALILLTVTRFTMIKKFTRDHVTLGRDFDPKKWENIFAFFTFLAGAIWGVAVCGALPGGDLQVDSLLGYILAGVTSGAAVAYSVSLKSTYGFFLPSVIPFGIRLALTGGEVYWGMALMIFAYSIVFLKLTHKFNQYAIRSIILSFQKDRLIERIRLMQSQVTQSAQMAALGQMAGGMAHEINNPVGIIAATCALAQETLQADGTPPNMAQDFAKIEAAAVRISKVVKELRFFAGRPGDEHYETVPFAGIIEKAMAFCNARFSAHKISFNVEAIDPSLMIECRPYHMTQVILNLLNNSFDAVSTNEERWVRIEVVDLGEKIEAAVVDSGPGIPEEIRNKIMQPFFSTKEIGRGMGLGLSVSRGILASHSGELWLDTGSPNTRFVVSLPKSRNTATGTAA